MIKILHRLEWFLALAFLQVLVLNRMHIGGYATPFFYIYFILKFNSRIGRNGLMMWAFALFRTPLMRLVTLRDVDEGFRPGVKTLGVASFFRYVLLTCGLFCTVIWLIDTFSFFHIGTLLLKILASTVSTLICVMCAESIGGKKE